MTPGDIAATENVQAQASAECVLETILGWSYASAEPTLQLSDEEKKFWKEVDAYNEEALAPWERKYQQVSPLKESVLALPAPKVHARSMWKCQAPMHDM